MPVHLDIKPKEGIWIDPKSYFDQIAKAGYQARKDDVVLTMAGTVTQEDGKLILVVADVKPGPQKFLLLAESSRKPAETEAFAQALKQARDSVDKKVEIEGRWMPPAKTPGLASIAVRSLKPART